jgi:hypothetical protein
MHMEQVINFFSHLDLRTTLFIIAVVMTALYFGNEYRVARKERQK